MAFLPLSWTESRIVPEIANGISIAALSDILLHLKHLLAGAGLEITPRCHNVAAVANQYDEFRGRPDLGHLRQKRDVVGVLVPEHISHLIHEFDVLVLLGPYEQLCGFSGRKAPLVLFPRLISYLGRHLFEHARVARLVKKLLNQRRSASVLPGDEKATASHDHSLV